MVFVHIGCIAQIWKNCEQHFFRRNCKESSQYLYRFQEGTNMVLRTVATLIHFVCPHPKFGEGLFKNMDFVLHAKTNPQIKVRQLAEPSVIKSDFPKTFLADHGAWMA